MKKEVYNTTKDRLLNVTVPDITRTYKPISHGQLMDLTHESILKAGFSLEKESYTMAKNGQIANGTYLINNIADKEMQIQIGWQNSYNRQVTLKYAIGTHIFICSNGSVSGDYGSFKRKHTGDVQEFTPKHIIEYIKTAGDVFVEMQKQREILKNVEVTKRMTAELVGRMYLEEGFIHSTQLNIIKNELEHPTYDYGAPDSLWQLYNFVTYSLKNDHPADWMQDHIDAHKFFMNNTGILLPENQFQEAIVIEEPKSPHVQLSWVEEMAKLGVEA